jgi:6-phosphogluconolactonase/glucosamine-6-phosphate isomerase/deaminase
VAVHDTLLNVSETYDIAPGPARPPLPGSVIVREEFDDLVHSIAADVLVQAYACVRAFGSFHLALAGGPDLEQVYKRLMIDPAFRPLPWRRTHLWIIRDRPAEAAKAEHETAWGMIGPTLADHSGMPASQIHPIAPHLPDAAERYERALQEALEWREPGHDRLDCALLSLEEEVARTDPPAAAERLVARGGDEDDSWVGLTRRMLNGARFVGVVCRGERAWPHVDRLLAEEAPLGLSLLGGELRWYLDGGAAGRANDEEPRRD